MNKGTYSGSKLIAGGDRLINSILINEESNCLLQFSSMYVLIF